jgi:DNA-binding NtrC family response regulator
MQDSILTGGGTVHNTGAGERLAVLFLHYGSDSPEFKKIAEAAGCCVHEVFSLRQALSFCQAHPEIPTVVCTPDCPDGSWPEVIERLREVPAHPEVLILSGDRDPEFWAEALNSGAFEVITAPFQTDQIQRLLQNAQARWQRKRETHAERHRNPCSWMTANGDSSSLS